MTEETIRTIGAAIVSSLPVFGVFAVNQKITKEFNKGWYGAMQDTKAYQDIKKYRCSLFWSLPLLIMTLVLLTGMTFSIYRTPRLAILAVFGSVPIIILTFLILYSFSLRLFINDDKLEYSNIFFSKSINYLDISDVKCFAGYLVITLKDKKIRKVPLIFGNLANLGSSLKNKIL